MSMIVRRRFSFFSIVSILAVAAAAWVAGAQVATAQSWPTRPVTMVVPFAAGSASDTVARILAARLSELLGQQVVIENIGGAGGMTGAARVAKAAPDGYQFVLGGIDTFAQNQTLYKKPLYNSVTEFAPVALMVEQPLVLVARKDLPISDLRAARPASARVRISPARSSMRRLASTSPMFRTAARHRRCRT
jgi:tripartite-type tricarboxylate transporter receptor subunit TctC